MGSSKYTTITRLLRWMPERNVVNCAIDRSGASLADPDAVRAVEDIITAASDDLDGYLRDYMDVPIVPTVESLTGAFDLTSGSTEVTILGGAALSELAPGDEVRPDGMDNIRCVVATVDGDDAITLEHVYYGEDATGAALSRYVTNVPSEIELLVRGHAAYLLWDRRKQDRDNPQAERERLFVKRVREIQEGRYKIRLVGGTVIARKPTGWNRQAAYEITDAALKEFKP